MKALGLITEYNPMHFGHTYHIRQSQALTNPDVTIAVMSGSVVQRGDFAMHSKFIRAHTALSNGVDLVIEIPSFFVLQAADYFAEAGVYLLDQLGVKDLVFGSESGDINALKSLQKLQENPAYQTALKAGLARGLSYPDAAFEASQNTAMNAALTPNNILGISYLKAIQKYASPMQAHTIKREKRTYYEALKSFQKIQSATAIRTTLKQGKRVKHYVPAPLSDSIDELKGIDLEAFYDAFSYRLKMIHPDAFNHQFGFYEGLENRFLKAKSAPSLMDFLDRVKTPRYTYAHLGRAMMHFLLHTPAHFSAYQTPPYIRILGMNETGQSYLNHVKKTTELPFFTSAKSGQHPLLDFELKISQLIESKTQDHLSEQDMAPPIRI